jgi:acetyl-CoA C-acetyltransferase
MLASQNVRRVAIIGSNRIPFVRSNTAYSYASNQEMMTAALNGLVERFNLQGVKIDEVAGGAVVKHSKDSFLMRESVLGTKLAPETPAVDFQQACATGLQAAIHIANKIALGQIDCGIAGGTDTTSDAPIAISEKLRVKFLDINRAKSTGDRIKRALKIRLSDFGISIPVNAEARTGLSMGHHTQITADYYGIDRKSQDEVAYNSHKKLAKAYEEGFFNDLITPFKGVTKDNVMRADTTLEKLSTLKGVFKGSGSMTAGNSSTLTDGASCVLMATEEWAKERGLPVLAYLTFAEMVAVEFVQNKQDLLLAPVIAVSNLLKKTGLKLQDFDFYEIHEAFGTIVAADLKLWADEKYCKEKLGLSAALGTIDMNKLNVKGGGIAAGHPFAATGGRMIGTLAKIINEKGSGRGLIALCAAGGQGIAMIIEK